MVSSQYYILDRVAVQGYHNDPRFPRPSRLKKIDELLNISAPLAWQFAQQLCRRDTATESGCAWTHGIWQYLRLMGLVGSIEYRADFYRQALTAVSGSGGTPRILVSGTADCAMLAHVLAAFRERGIEPDITVVDLCGTPLAMNHWYAGHAGCKIETIRCDILAYSTDTAFDAICTDAFIGRFAPPSRPALIAKWHELLRPGGLLITYNRLRPPSAGERVGFTPAQARVFRETVLSAALTMREVIDIDPQQLAECAEIYARRHVTYSVHSAQEIQTLCENAGFKTEQLATITASATDGRGVSGPSMHEGADYLSIVARRT